MARLEAELDRGPLGGTLEVTSPAGNGTALLIEIPAESPNNPGTPEP